MMGTSDSIANTDCRRFPLKPNTEEWRHTLLPDQNTYISAPAARFRRRRSKPTEAASQTFTE